MRYSIFIMLALLMSCNNQKKTTKNKIECLSTFKIDDHTGLNRDYILNGNIDWNDFMRKETIVSDTVNDKLMLIDSSNLKYQASTPLFYMDTINKTLVVNNEVANAIKRTSAIKGKENINITILKLKSLYNKLALKDIIRQLMHLEIIETYMHLYADVCLVEENESDNEIILSYSITHHFCTNECQDETEKAVFKLNKETGALVMN